MIKMIRSLTALVTDFNIFILRKQNYAKVVNVFGRRTVDTAKPKESVIPTGVVPEQAEDVGVISGVPEEHLKKRVANIHIKTRNCMQTGTFQSDIWKIEFDQREKWENPLIGWESTGDPLSDTDLEFSSKEDAILFCKRIGYKIEVEEKHSMKGKPKSYADNFSWNSKKRIQTK